MACILGWSDFQVLVSLMVSAKNMENGKKNRE